MHIVFITNEYPTKGIPHGGIGTFIRNLARELTFRSVNVTVIGFYKGLPSDYFKKNEDGITIYRLPISGWIFLKAIEQSVRLNFWLKKIHKNSPVTHVETPELGLAFLWKIPGIKYVIRMNGGHHFFAESEKRRVNFLRGWIERRSFKKADAFIGVSRYVAESTNRLIPYDLKKLEIINNFVNPDKFQPRFDIPVSRNRIVFVGTICEKKGIRQLVMAMPFILSKFPDAELLIAGRDWFFPDGKSYTEYLKTFISDHLAPQVKFLGVLPNDEVSELLASATICVYPSHMEAMPLAWMEALMAGKAVVASSEGPGPEVIFHEKTGLLCNPYDPTDIAEKIIRLLSDPELVIKLGQEARRDSLSRFTPEELVKRNLIFYSRILID